ncbi:MAG TPA: RNA polymerase sigma-70 factor [Chitinophagaceae bacterium]|nr:RNA polymerase sigma-70 factor [Chitinophagaceae bacterium]
MLPLLMMGKYKTIQQRIFNNEEEALGELYQLFSARLLQFAKAVVHNHQAAEEIVEDIFVKLWCNRTNITTIDNITVYLYIAVKNRCLNFISRKAKDMISAPFDFIDIEVVDETATPQDILVTAEMMQNMHRAVEALPPRCKMVFKLVREDGLKYKEVAQILNISVNTVDVQMAIAVKRICNALGIKKNVG